MKNSCVVVCVCWYAHNVCTESYILFDVKKNPVVLSGLQVQEKI